MKRYALKCIFWIFSGAITFMLVIFYASMANEKDQEASTNFIHPSIIIDSEISKGEPVRFITVSSNGKQNGKAADNSTKLQKEDAGIAKELPMISKVKNDKECTSKDFDYKDAHQDDPKLIEFIRAVVIHPPSLRAYSLRRPKAIDYSEKGQSQYADNTYLHGMMYGFFVEAGALDGEHHSNSLYFEKRLGWRGLLVEPFPHAARRLLRKNRNAYFAQVALSNTTRAYEGKLQLKGKMGLSNHLGHQGIAVPTMPLYSLLRALEVDVVDFLSLDVSSFEFEVLQTLPWDKVKFRLMCIEVDSLSVRLKELTRFLQDKGYAFLEVKLDSAWFGLPKLLSERMEI